MGTPRRRSTAVAIGSSSQDLSPALSPPATTSSTTASPSVAALEAEINALRSKNASLEAQLHDAVMAASRAAAASTADPLASAPAAADTVTQPLVAALPVADPAAAAPPPGTDVPVQTTSDSLASAGASQWDLTAWLRSLPMHEALARLLSPGQGAADQLQFILQIDDDQLRASLAGVEEILFELLRDGVRVR